MDPAQLNGNQKQIYDKAILHCQQYLGGLDPAPFLLNIDGTAGTGKSFLIDAITQTMAPLLEDNFMMHKKPISLVMRLASTGVAAFNIGGRTYHSALGLGVDDGRSRMAGESQIARLQEERRGIRYLIIDENSMIGQTGLGKIEERLWEIEGAALGGLSVMLVGDFGQLPPVADTPLFNGCPATNTSAHSRLASLGFMVDREFDKSITLSQVMHQDGQDALSIAFRDRLGRLRDRKATAEDHALLSTCFWSSLDRIGWQAFEMAD